MSSTGFFSVTSFLGFSYCRWFLTRFLFACFRYCFPFFYFFAYFPLFLLFYYFFFSPFSLYSFHASISFFLSLFLFSSLLFCFLFVVVFPFRFSFSFSFSLFPLLFLIPHPSFENMPSYVCFLILQLILSCHRGLAGLDWRWPQHSLDLVDWLRTLATRSTCLAI